MTGGSDAGILASALTLGFLGSTHCIGMCGGIASALTYALPPSHQQGWRSLAYSFFYSAGRIGTYALLGAVVGAAGAGLLANWSMMLWPRLMAGGFMLIMGLYIAGWWKGLLYLESIGKHLWKQLQPLNRKLLPINTPLKALGAGAIWGFLPCGLVYSALGLATTVGNIRGSALVMLLFGLGTLPTVLLTGSMAASVRNIMQSEMTRRLAGTLIIICAIWTVQQAWQHHREEHAATNVQGVNNQP